MQSTMERPIKPAVKQAIDEVEGHYSARFKEIWKDSSEPMTMTKEPGPRGWYVVTGGGSKSDVTRRTESNELAEETAKALRDRADALQKERGLTPEDLKPMRELAKRYEKLADDAVF